MTSSYPEKLLKIVTEKGLTIKALAKRTHYHRTVLSRKFHGKRKISLEDFVAISKALEMTPDELAVKLFKC